MIPTYIVDDVDSDRYIARRRLTKARAFDPISESRDGVDFLDGFLGDGPPAPDALPPLILMDINMPQMDGFETVESMARRWQGPEDQRPIVAMFSSSDNDRDIERSAAIDSIRFYFTKPINDAAIAEILDSYRASGHQVAPPAV